MTTPALTLPATRFDRAYPGTPDQIRAIRADLRAFLTDCPAADNVILCASELATNAALHSNSALPGGQLTTRGLITRGQHVRIEVHDQGGPWPHTRHGPDRHHGLDIVHALAVDWGIDGDYRARTTWARLTWTTRTSSLAHPQQPPTGTSPAAILTRARTSPRPGQWTAILYGPQLQRLRRLHGLSQEQLARHAGLSLTTIRRLEHQTHPHCRTRTTVSLAIALSEHPATLLRGLTRTPPAGQPPPRPTRPGW